MSETNFLLLADPGKYQYHTCKQLAEARKRVLDREGEFRELIDKAEKEPGGVVVGAIAYRADYVALGQELKVVDATARDKNCNSPPAAPAAPTRRSDSAIQ